MIDVMDHGRTKGSGHSASSSRTQRVGMIGTRSADPLRDSGRYPTANVNRIHDRSTDPSVANINALAGRGPSIHDKPRGAQAVGST